MLKDEVKTSRGCRLQERMRRRKGGEGVTPLEAARGQATGGCWTQRGGILRSPSCPGPRAEEGRVCSNGARCGPCDVGCRWHGHSGGQGIRLLPERISQKLGGDREEGPLAQDPWGSRWELWERVGGLTACKKGLR